jgi:hypothetical protein
MSVRFAHGHASLKMTGVLGDPLAPLVQARGFGMTLRLARLGSVEKLVSHLIGDLYKVVNKFAFGLFIF